MKTILKDLDGDEDRIWGQEFDSKTRQSKSELESEYLNLYSQEGPKRGQQEVKKNLDTYGN